MISNLNRQHVKYLLIEQSLIPGVLNLVINGAIAYLIFGINDVINIWGESPNVGVDTIATFILLPLITTMIVTATTRKKVSSGKLAKIAYSTSISRILNYMPYSSFWRSVLFGLIGFVAAICVLALLQLLEIRRVEAQTLVLLKSLYTMVLGATLTPVIAILALS